VAAGVILLAAVVAIEAFDAGGDQVGWGEQLLLAAGASAVLSGAAWRLGLRNRYDIGALVGGTCLAVLYMSPALRPLLTHGMSWPTRTAHAEGLSLTTNGRWWVLPPHNYLADAFSGDFPVFYNYLSDAGIAAIAALSGWPPMVVQVSIWAPFLAFLFVTGAYWSVKQVVKSPPIALTAALIVSLLGNSQLPRLVSDRESRGLDSTLHVPFHALGLATDQSLGWVLFLPCTCLLFAAYNDFKPHRGIILGALLGLLLHAHLLTFANVAAIQVVYLALANGIEHRRDRKWRLWLSGVATVLLVDFVLIVATANMQVALLVGSLAMILGLTFLLDSRKAFYLWTYGTAAVVAAPFLLSISTHLGDISAKYPLTVSVRDGVLFFSVYLLATGYAFVAYRDRPVIVWLAACIGATLFLALNNEWGWENHPYRFVIHLLFPLGIGTAIAVHTLPRRLAAPLALWLIALAALNVTNFATGDRVYVEIIPGTAAEARFLAGVDSATAGLDGAHERILNGAGEDLMTQTGSALMLNYSHIPGFVPDYRYIVDRERYLNRVATFCSLIPAYVCRPEPRPYSDLFRVLDGRLRGTIAAVYRIRRAGSIASPFAEMLRSAAGTYGWKLIAEKRPDAVLYRVRQTPMEGVAHIGAGRSEGDRIAISFSVEHAGDQFILIGGRRLGTTSSETTVDGKPTTAVSSSADWAVRKVRLTAGEHRLTLAQPAAPDDLVFVNVIEASKLSRYVMLNAPR
jgi:hypothetical protein